MVEAVILIHGMGRTRRSMLKLEKQLQQSGFVTFNQSYPSTQQTVEQSAEQYISSALKILDSEKMDKVHFVTHSLGGVLIRQYLSHQNINNLGKIVMLAPPNQGSHVTDKYGKSWWYKLITGKAGQQLYSSNNPMLEKIKPLNCPTLILAGNKSSDPWFNPIFDQPHDGKVAVKSTRLPEIHEFVELDCGHTLIMKNQQAIDLTINFLKI